MAGDTNLKGSVSIAEGLTASSATMKTGNITFAEGGQGFYDYTPEEDKTDYKTGAIAESENISKTRKPDINGVAHVDVTEPTTNSGYAKLASALYAGEATYSSDPMIVDMGGKGLALSATTGTGQAAAIYANDNAYINVVNPSAEQKLTITSNNTSTTGAHGIYAKGNAHLNISGLVEITDVTTKGDAANGISIQGEKSEIKIDGSLKISNVKGVRERGKGMNAAGIGITGDKSTVTVTGPVDISGVRGSGIKLVGANSKVSVGGGNITAAEDSDKSHNFYAVRVEKGTLDINMKDGAAGDTTTTISGDMYATGQYGKKVVEYTGGELIDWKDAGILNVALTNDKSFWKGVAAYDQYNSDYGSGGNTMHDIGQFNLYLQNGAAWTNEQQSHVTTTTVSKAKWDGSTLASLHGGKDAANAGLIYQKDNNPISVVDYSGHTTVFYEHDASDPTNIIGGNFNITNAAKGSAITFVTDNTGITSGFEDGDSAEAKENVANVLNSMAGKLFYKNYADGNLAGVVKIADGLTASSAALKTGDISFSTEDSGTKTPGQGYYDYKPSGEKPEYNTGAISKSEDISKTRELNADGIAEVKVTEPTITEGYSKFAAALYAEEASVPMNVKMAGKGLALSSVVEKGAQAAGIFVANGANITVANPTADQKLTITAANNDTYGAYGIFVKGTAAKLNVSGPVEITDVTTKGAAVGGIVVRGQNTDVVIDGPLKISNVKAEADSADGINGAGISVTGVGSTVTVNGPVDISGIYGSGIRLTEAGNKVSVGGGNIAAAADTDKSHNYYAVRVERGTLDINMKDGVAGDTTTTISGDMYINCLHGMKPPSLGSEEIVEFKDAGILNVALTNDKSSWTGVAAHEKYKTDKHQYGYDMHDVGEFNLYLQNGATWTNEQQSHVTSTTMADKNPVWDGSTLASLRGGNDAAHAGNIFQKDSKNITIENYSGNTNIFYAHEGNGEAAENYKAGDIVIKSAAKNSAVSLITDNTDVSMDNSDNVAKVLNALAGKLTYSNFAAGEKNLKGYVKIADGLTASSKALKTGDISFSTETTGTKTPGQGYYEYDETAENTFTDKITGGNDKKYVEAGIEKEKGVYTFTKDATIKVTKGLSELGAIESSGGPITINADGKTLDVSYTVPKGDNVARAVATGNSFGKSKDITIKADSLKLTADTTGFRAQGVYAVGGKVTIDANTTISTSAQNDSNGIYAGNNGVVTMNGNLDIQEDTKANEYYALNADGSGVINVNVKNGKAGAGTVKLKGDIFTKSAESYDYWEDETTTTSSAVNLALQGEDSSWTGRSLYEVTSSGDDKTSYGSFNLWLTDGASWNNQKNAKVMPNGFAGSHVTNFVGGADAAHAGNIFQNDSKSLTIDKYSGNTNIFYAHEGNGEAAADYKAGDTIIKSAAKDSAVSLITDNSNVAMDNADSVASVLNALAGKLTYSNFASGEKNLTGVVKIADGLTASSAALKTGDISFNEAGKGFYDYTPVDDTHFTDKITGYFEKTYQELGIEKEQGIYNFRKDTTIAFNKGKETALTTIGSKGGPVTINAEGKTLDVSYTVDTGNFDVRAVASETIYGGKNITINAGKLNLSVENGGTGMSQAVLAKVGATVTINADTAIFTSSKKESNGIYAGNRGVVNMNGNLEIQEDTGAEKYYALKADGTGIVNVNIKDNNAGDNVVKFNGDIFAKDKDSGINLALKGAESSWTGSSMNESADSAKHGQFNLWLADGAAWTNKVMNKTVAAGFAGSHVTSFVGGSDAAHAGSIFQNDSNNLTIDSYSGNTNIFYAHTGNGEAASDYAAGDTVIKHAAEGSVVSMITDNSGITMDNENSVANVLNTLAGKLTYSNFVNGEKNLTGYVKIAGGLTNDSVTIKSGKIQFAENGKGSYSKPAATKFTTTLTGDADADEEYAKADVIQGDGSYKFAEDTSINVSGEGAKGMNFVKGTAIDASGKTLTINVTDASKGNAGIAQDIDVNSSVKADKLVIKLDSTKSGQGAQGIRQTKGNLTVDGNVDIDVKGDNSTMGVYSHAGSTTINGDVKVKLDGNHGGFAEYGAAGIYAHAGYGGAVGGTINVNGNVDISGVGNGLFANIGGGTINVNGGKINIVDDNTKTGYSAIYSTCGAINMNTVKDGKGNVIGAGNNKVDITGNVVVSVGAVNYVDCCTETEVNLGLTTKDSQLTGVIYNEFPEGGKTASQGGNKKLFTGEANLWLQNGATWTNEQQGTLANVYQGEKFTGSRVAKLTGGATAEAAGNIYQKESGALTIDNYSGNTNIFYEHAGDGVTFNAGDTVIKHAEKGSAVNLITSNKGLSINAETINDTLNALAGKLTYTSYKDGERNLDGKVKIAGGLTSDSVTVAAGDILFSSSDGKGNGVTNLNVQAPDHQTSTSFGSTLTGDTEEDLEYVLGGVVKDGSYKFTENTTINVNGKDARGMDFAEGTVVDANGKTLTINVTDGTKLNAGISQIKNVDSHVKADKIVIKLDSKDASGTTHAIHQDKGNLTIDGDVDIDITGQRHTVGVYSHAGSTTINGNVKVVLDGNHGGFAEYGAAGIYAHANYGGAVGGTINVNGNVDISGVGNGLFANIGGGTINVNGGRINIIDDNTDTGYSAIYSTCGAINMNTVKDEKGNVIGAGNNKVDITGNVVVSVGAVNYVDCYEYSLVNLGLTTKDSQLTGVIYNEFPEGGKTASQGGNKKLFTGEANLWLQNGATWTNEQQGTLANVYQGEKFTGSHVAKLTGGATAEAAGNIYQKESGALTIDNYSGNTNIFYEHAGDGVTFNAGDTVIRHAEKDSVVNLITSNKGLSLNADTINNTLNALAGKLTYSNYAKGERNLDGKVKIAGGLTSDSVTMAVGDILFNEADGKGSGAEHITVPSAPETQVSTSFNTTLTGEKLKDLEYVLGGVVKDGTYKFTENTAINVSGEGAKGMDFAKGTTIDASGKTLTVNVTDASKGNAGISQDVDVNSTIKADKLVIKLDSEKSGKGAQAIRQDKGKLTIDANVDIDVKGDNSTMGIYSHAGSTTVNGDVKIKLDGKRGGFNEYGAAGIYAHAGYGGAVGGTVNVNGNVDISGVGNGLFANIGGATINVNGGKINIVDTDKKNGYSAIYATCGSINMNTVKDEKGKVIGAGNNKVDITGNVVVSVGAVNYVDCCTETEVNLGLTTKDSKLTGVVYNQFPEGGKTVSQRGDSKTFTGAANLWLQNGALWTNEQQGELPSVWGGEKFNGSRVTNLVGGTNADNAGQIYQKDVNNLTIDTLSGSIKVIYDHEFEDAVTRAANEKKIVYKAGDTVINNAKEGSQVIMATGSNGINTFDKNSVEDAFKGLANKLIYKDAEKNPGNLKAELQLGGGLTGSNVSWSGQIEWDGDNGSYKLDSAEQSIKLLYDEDAVSKDTRAAIMSGMVGWRNAATDTYRARAGAYGEDNQGVWARTWGGQNKYTGNNTSFKNSYWAGQVGYDKTLGNGWNVGVAFDYMTGDDSYYAGSGDTKTYTLGLYGSKEINNNEFIDLTAKVGRVSNDFETKDILGRTVKGDYKANGFSFSGQYSKRFGSEAAGYFEPQAQLTIGRLGSSDFDSTGTLEGHISQDSFTSIVGRLGIEAGQASEHGRYFARLSLSHEFAGNVDTHFSDSSATMTREFNLDGTWCDLTVGGTYDLNDRVSFYGDVTKTLTGDYKQDWKVNAGLRFTF